jgi:hypothetical protein
MLNIYGSFIWLVSDNMCSSGDSLDLPVFKTLWLVLTHVKSEEKGKKIQCSVLLLSV